MVNDFEKKLRNELGHIWEEISEIVERQEGQIINQNSTLSRIDGKLKDIYDILHNTRYQTQRIFENTNENTDNVVELLQFILEQQKETNTLLKDLCDKKE